MVVWNIDYLAAGGNRHPSAADWDPASGLLAFGADRNIAIWSPLVWLSIIRYLETTHYTDRVMATKVSKYYYAVTLIL